MVIIEAFIPQDFNKDPKVKTTYSPRCTGKLAAQGSSSKRPSVLRVIAAKLRLLGGSGRGGGGSLHQHEEATSCNNRSLPWQLKIKIFCVYRSLLWPLKKLSSLTTEQSWVSLELEESGTRCRCWGQAWGSGHRQSVELTNK